MIHLEKLDKPEILKINMEEWTKKYQRLLKNGDPIPKELEGKYRNTKIKEQIKLETNDKCAYCESKISHSYFGDIEHIKPKSKFPDLIFDWQNLTFSCAVCNNNKGDKYDDSIRIINPYTDFPDDYLKAKGPMIISNEGNFLGKNTITTLKLNRNELLIRRTDKIEKLNSLIELYNSEEDISMKQLIEKQIINEIDKEKEYIFIGKEFIRQETDIVL